MSDNAVPQPTQVNMQPSAQYVPTPEEEEALQAIPRNFLKFGAMGFAGGAITTHLTLRSTIYTLCLSELEMDPIEAHKMRFASSFLNHLHSQF